jgi:hypothetical protein
LLDERGNERTSSDELKALLAGGIIASVFAYAAIRFSYSGNETHPELPFPFALPQHYFTPIGALIAPIIGVVIALYALYFVSLAFGYAMETPFKWENMRRKSIWWADRAFVAGSIMTFILAFVVIARFIEYVIAGGPVWPL